MFNQFFWRQHKCVLNSKFQGTGRRKELLESIGGDCLRSSTWTNWVPKIVKNLTSFFWFIMWEESKLWTSSPASSPKISGKMMGSIIFYYANIKSSFGISEGERPPSKKKMEDKLNPSQILAELMLRSYFLAFSFKLFLSNRFIWSLTFLFAYIYFAYWKQYECLCFQCKND